MIFLAICTAAIIEIILSAHFGTGSFIAINVALIFLIYKLIRSTLKNRIQAKSTLLKKVNDQYGTDFQIQNSTGGFYFDARNKMLLFDMAGGPVVKGIDYIRNYELTWIEKIVGNNLRFEKVQLEFHTTDIEHPLLKVICPSKNAGEVLMTKLGIIFDS